MPSNDRGALGDLVETSRANERLTKIRIDLGTSDSSIEGESFWAEPFGGQLYRLRNTPFYAFDLHFGDIVRAIQKSPGQMPTIREVVERSGHKTLRVIFTDQASEPETARILVELNDRATNHERAQGRLYALDVRPEADYQAVCDYLWNLEQRGLLHYETGTTLSARN